MHARTFAQALASAVVTAVAVATAVVGPATNAAHAAWSTSPATSPSLLPEPTGALAVGVQTVPAVSPDATTRLWYPARRGTGTGAPPYVADEVVAAYGMPIELARRAIPSASVDAEPAPTAKPRPVVVLMPGWGQPMALSTTLAQDLASHGYIVVTVDPALGSEDPMTMPADTADPGRRLEQVSAALDFVMGTAVTKFVGPVDRRRIAVGGHSIAGAVAFQTAISDSRVRAVFDLDGWLHGDALTTPVPVPALVVDASGLEPTTRAIIDRNRRVVTVELAGATHSDVTDLPCLVAALPAATKTALGTGAIGCAGTTTTDTVVLRFLDGVLRHGKATPAASSLTHDINGLGR